LHFHGGGFVLGSPELNDGSNRTLAAALGCVVVSVDYRLAPETNSPGPVEDGYAVLRWMNEEARVLGIDRRRIAVGGPSAGGGHAAALAIMARDLGEVSVCFQALEAPMLDDCTGSTSEPHRFCGEFGWTAGNNRYCWQALLGAEPGGPAVDPLLVPA